MTECNFCKYAQNRIEELEEKLNEAKSDLKHQWDSGYQYGIDYSNRKIRTLEKKLEKADSYRGLEEKLKNTKYYQDIKQKEKDIGPKLEDFINDRSNKSKPKKDPIDDKLLKKVHEILSEYPFSHIYKDYITVAREQWNHPERPGLNVTEVMAVAALKDSHKDNDVKFKFYFKEDFMPRKNVLDKVAAILKLAGFRKTTTTKGAQGDSRIRKVLGHPQRKEKTTDKIIQEFEDKLLRYRESIK